MKNESISQLGLEILDAIYYRTIMDTVGTEWNKTAYIRDSFSHILTKIQVIPDIYFKWHFKFGFWFENCGYDICQISKAGLQWIKYIKCSFTVNRDTFSLNLSHHSHHKRLTIQIQNMSMFRLKHFHWVTSMLPFSF